MAKNNKTLKSQIFTKLKNSNCDQSQKLKLLKNLKKKNCDKLRKSNCDKIQKIKL